MNRALGWAASVAFHLALLALLVFGHLLPAPVPPPEKVVVLDLSQVATPPEPPALPPLPPPPPPAETPALPSEPVPTPVPVPETPSSTSSDAGSAPASAGPARPAPAVETEPDYLPPYKIDQAPQLPVQAILDKIVYPPLAAKQGLEATVILDLYIDQIGRIRKITVLKDPGYGFAEAAVAALEGRTVIPARSQGQPCAVRFRYPVRFTLK